MLADPLFEVVDAQSCFLRFSKLDGWLVELGHRFFVLLPSLGGASGALGARDEASLPCSVSFRHEY